VAGPFYFAWTDSTDTTFDATRHNVYDEIIFNFDLMGQEGQFDTLQLEIKNPQVGLFAPTRSQFAWFSWYDGSTIQPLFFGCVIGIPSDLTKETITIQLVARPGNYLELKQQYAETLKQLPYWDPVFLDDTHRDDPDSIIEARGALYHIDRITHAITTSSLTSGEDGTLTFTPSKVMDGSVTMTMAQQPLSDVHVEANVTWSQSGGGSVSIPTGQSITTLTGTAILADWPKVGQSLGGGWIVQSAQAEDVYSVDLAPTYTFNRSWKNEQQKHQDGDPLSIEEHLSKPSFPVGYYLVLTETEVIGIGDPQTGHAASIDFKRTDFYVALYNINTSLTLGYGANLNRKELMSFTLETDLQQFSTSPEADNPMATTENIKVQGTDVSTPILNILNSASVRGKTISQGQTILTPDGQSYQRCLSGGTCGTGEPIYSNVINATTVDGTATWVCIGASLDDPPRNWAAVQNSEVSRGVIIRATTNTVSTGSNTTVTVSNSGVQTTTIRGGNVIADPSGQSGFTTGYWMAISAGTTGGTTEPDFPDSGTGTVDDGSVTWLGLGPYGVPAFLAPPMGPLATNYFCTDRGQDSIKYLLLLARAHLVIRARAVKINWECKWGDALALSCRKSATIQDHKISGGTATGKITEFHLTGNGDSGAFGGKVQIECLIGTGGTLPGSSTGTGVYFAPGYLIPGQYQATTGDSAITPTGDVAFTRPLAPSGGLSFPLSADQVVMKAQWHVEEFDAQIANNTTLTLTYDPQLSDQENIAKQAEAQMQYWLKTHPTWFELELLPLDGTADETTYLLGTTSLVLDKQIDLQATSW
jgi:hypothetical protein